MYSSFSKSTLTVGSNKYNTNSTNNFWYTIFNDNGSSGISLYSYPNSIGDIYSIGYYNTSGLGYNACIVKQNLSGNVIWQKSILGNLPDGKDNSLLTAIAFDSSINLYMTGYIWNDESTLHGFITKYNPKGIIQWQKDIGGSANIITYSISSDTLNNLYICNYYNTVSTTFVTTIMKYNSSGVLQWQRQLSNSVSNVVSPWWITTDISNNVYVTGYFFNSVNGVNSYIAKYNSSGTLQWQRSLADGNTAASQNTQAYYIITDSSNNVYVVGDYRNASGAQNAFLVKYNSSGTLQWQRSLADGNTAASQSTSATAIITDISGNVYVSGNFKNTSSGRNTFLVKYNSSGTLQWQRSLADGNTAASQNSSFGCEVILYPSSDICLSFGIKNIGSTNTSSVFLKLPIDGTKTGKINFNSSNFLTYSSGSLTDSAGSLTSATSTLTDAAGSNLEIAGNFIMGTAPIKIKTKGV